MPVLVGTPQISVRLRKSVDRNNAGKSISYSMNDQNYYLDRFLTENSTVSFTRSINAPSGTFQITVGDRGVMFDLKLESLYGIVEPMDVIEIRMAQSPHEYASKSLERGLPIVFRGLVTNITRNETMSPDGKPQRTVTISGQDFGKFFQIIQDRYIPGNPMGTNWLTLIPMEVHYGIPYGAVRAGTLMDLIMTNIVRPFLKKYSSPALRDVMFGLDVSGADPDDWVMSQGTSAMPMGTLWEFMSKYCDLGPFYEAILEDKEAGPHLVYRKPPVNTIDGSTNIHGVDVESLTIRPQEITSISSTRSDANVINWAWIKHARISGWTEQDIRYTSLENNGDLGFIKTPNSDVFLYGLRVSEVESYHSSVFRPGMKKEESAEAFDLFRLYFKPKIDKFKAANQDNSAFETGTIVMKGNEKVKPGMILMVVRDESSPTYYAQSVTQTFVPFKSFTTTVQYTRGKGFIDLAYGENGTNDHPYLSYIGHGPYESQS